MSFRKAPVFPLAALLLVAGLCPTAAASTLCGDDVAGERVACSCGDTVVSDTRLREDDPVAATRCPRNGLQLRAPAPAGSIVLDMAGLSLLGRGSGTGILILDGGAEGAVIIGGNPAHPGQVGGFRMGVRALGRHGLKAAYNLELRANGSDGLAVTTDDAEVTP